MNRIGLVLLGLVARAFALAPLVSGCAPRVAYQADRRFSDADRAEIERAARAWDAIVKPDRRIVAGKGWLVLREEPPEGGFNGLCRRSARTIWIRPEPVGASVYAVALHEWGHALGLGHTARGVMMATDVSIEFSGEVLDECRRVGACP